MGYHFNPFTGNFDQSGTASVPDPLTLDNLTVNNLLTANHIHGGIAGSLYIHVKNTSGVPLSKGTPVYAVGAVGDTTTLEVAAADASNADKIPAIGLLGEALNDNQSGHAVMFGEITGFNTGSYQINDELYLANGGGLTATKPASGYAQSLAVVGRVHANTGTILVWTASGIPSTDLSYDAATREVRSSTGTDATIPLVSTSSAGLKPATSHSAITYSSTVDLDMAVLDGQTRTISVTGDLQFTTSNLATGRTLKLRLLGDGSNRVLTFPSDWKFQGTKPATLTANKVARLVIECFGTTNADVDAVCTVQL